MCNSVASLLVLVLIIVLLWHFLGGPRHRP